MRQFLRAFLRDERGISAMEYALLASMVIVALAAVGATFNSGYSGIFTTMFSKVTSVQAA